jgi:hypothetical protein
MNNKAENKIKNFKQDHFPMRASSRWFTRDDDWAAGKISSGDAEKKKKIRRRIAQINDFFDESLTIFQKEEDHPARVAFRDECNGIFSFLVSDNIALAELRTTKLMGFAKKLLKEYKIDLSDFELPE